MIQFNLIKTRHAKCGCLPGHEELEAEEGIFGAVMSQGPRGCPGGDPQPGDGSRDPRGPRLVVGVSGAEVSPGGVDSAGWTEGETAS